MMQIMFEEKQWMPWKDRDSRATEPLIELLKDQDITIQEEAITALGRIQDKKAVQPLIQTLNNQHIGIRWKAAEALGKIGDPKATEALIQTLHDPDKTIQEEAITALEEFKIKEQSNHLSKILTIYILELDAEQPKHLENWRSKGNRSTYSITTRSR